MEAMRLAESAPQRALMASTTRCQTNEEVQVEANGGIPGCGLLPSDAVQLLDGAARRRWARLEVIALLCWLYASDDAHMEGTDAPAPARSVRVGR
jgi:hypothetical protein